MGGISFWCKYEDLVADPMTTLSKLCDSLGFEFDDNMLAQTSSEILMPEYRHGRFLSEKAKDVPELALEINSLIQPWLDRLGY